MSSRPVPVAVAPAKSAIMVAPKTTPPKAANKEGKDNGKMHKRSRSGCFTCRLRRKKCDEGNGLCRACRHLGLECEYKRPHWWSNAEHRRNMKETIKERIKHTKTTEKIAHQKQLQKEQQQQQLNGSAQQYQQPKHHTSDTPPALSHSMPTSATYSITPRTTRAPSVCSPYSPHHQDHIQQPTPPQQQLHHDPHHPYSIAHCSDFSQPSIHDSYESYAYPHVLSPPYDTAAPYYHHPYAPAPYEVDIKTECQMYVDDVPTRKDSSTSTFSTYHPPPGVPALSPEAEWAHDGVFETADIFGIEQPPVLEGEVDHASFDDIPLPTLSSSPNTTLVPVTAAQQAVHIDVDECDRPLLDHFIDHVLRHALPVLEITRPGAARAAVVLPALATNKCYLHCCLSIAGIDLKATQYRTKAEQEQLDGDIMRHRYECVQALCSTLNADHQQTLHATLGMILFPCSVGGADTDLPDIPWHAHFEAASSLVRKLQLPHALEQTDGGGAPHPPFNMSLTAWIDILGATMLGRSPLFADTYREQHEAGASTGLAAVMGCDDRVMYLISEIACLDALQSTSAVDGLQVYELIASLGHHLDATETGAPLESALTPTGAIRPTELTNTLTSAYRLAARLYLCNLVPGTLRSEANTQSLVDRLATVLDYIPAGPTDGFDRALVWPLLIGGARSMPGSRFRAVLEDRITLLGDHAAFGSFGRMIRLLREVWRLSDGEDGGEQERNVHWRDVMQQQGWEFLMI